MEKITIRGKILRKVSDPRVLRVNEEAAIEDIDEEGNRRLMIIRKTDEKVLPDGCKVERFVVEPS